MLLDEAKQITRYMVASFTNANLNEQQVAVWVETLAPLDSDTCIEAIRNLRAEIDWFPTHHQFMDACQAVRKGKALPPGDDMIPDVCALCEGNRWVQIGVLGLGDAVGRCKCWRVGNSVKADGSHKSGCNCGQCHYGAERWKLIRAGADGVGKPEGEHPLKVQMPL